MEKRGTDKSCPFSTNPFFFAKAAAATAPPNATCGPNTEPKLNVPITGIPDSPAKMAIITVRPVNTNAGTPPMAAPSIPPPNAVIS